MSIYLDEFETLYGISDNIEKLRSKILELAFKGKLTDQNKNENIDNIIEKMKKEKPKKFKKENLVDNSPYKLPNNWVWMKHSQLFDISGGSQPPKSKFIYEPKEGYIRLYQTRDYGDNPQPAYIPIEDARKKSKEGEILLARYGGSLGKVFKAKNGAYNVALVKVEFLYNFEYVDNNFLFYFYKSNLYQKFTNSQSRSAQSGFNKSDFNNLNFPLPPREEQKRIVDKIEKLMTEVDKLEEKLNQKEQVSQKLSESIVSAIKNSQNAEELKANLKFTIDNFDVIFKTSESMDEMRNIVLQLAIEGKLVPQNERDEPASELIKKIEKEKEKLINESKLRNSRIKEINENDIPFEIPYKWEWVRLNEVAYINNGKAPSKYELNDSGKYPYIKVSDMNLPKNEKEIEVSNNYTDDLKENNLIPEYSIIFPKRGGAIATNKKRIVKKQIYIDSNTMALTPINKETFLYFKTWFDKLDLWELNSGTAVPQINNKDINPLIIPLPPLEEQKRIVKKVDSIMDIIDKLEMELEKKEDLVEKLGTI